jgi:hypothetical protein
VHDADDLPKGPLRRAWRWLARRVSWTRPTSGEIGTVLKSGLAAGLAWSVALLTTDIPDPVLAPFTAIVVVQVSVGASVRTALQRSGAVVLGVLIALLVGDALSLNGFTVGLLVALSLAIAQLIMRLPAASARQVPISLLVVLSTVASSPVKFGGQRALDTILGAAVGVIVSLALPASRLIDARQTIERLSDGLAGVLHAMDDGLQEPWSTAQTEEWRRRARAARERLVHQAAEAVGNGRETARWNVRDRRHMDTLGHFEDVMPRFERAAIGVSVIARGLDDHARLSGTTHPSMAKMGFLFGALAGAIRTFAQEVLDPGDESRVDRALDEVRARRALCAEAASRRARFAIEHHDEPDAGQAEGEWLGYAALIVQVDRIVADLSLPLPA